MAANPSLEDLAHTVEALEDARSYAESIVDTVREPLLVLDADLRIITGASRACCTKRGERNSRLPAIVAVRRT